MKNLKVGARIFFGVGIAGLGILHFIYPGFRPVILPVPPEATQQFNFLIYLTGAFLFGTGLAIALGKAVKTVSLFLGVVLLLFFVLGHLPNRLMNQPASLGAWTDALKLLALSGGAFIVAKTFPGNNNSKLTASLGKITFLGKYFFGIMFIIFGIDHFLYIDFVKTLVPLWIPGNVFWTYFAAIALIGSGLAIIINFKIKTISILLGTMLFLWLIILHIPRAITMDTSKDPNEIVSVLECLAFSGIAFLLYFDKK
jgi:uncharacterized membrane protein YphA (DoxX/SURF4 family)